MSPKRELMTDVEKDAVENVGSRTALLYLSVSFLILFIAIILTNPIPLLLVIVGLFLLVTSTLLYISIRHRHKKQENTELFSKSIKTHLFILFITSIFVAPFVGSATLNSESEPIYGTPFSLISAISFGYVSALLGLGVPTVFIVSGTRERRARKRREQQKMEQAKRGGEEIYNLEKHGEIREAGGIHPKFFIAILIFFSIGSIAMIFGGIATALDPEQDTAAGIVCAVFSLPFIGVTIFTGILYFGALIKRSILEKNTAAIYSGEKAYVSTAKIITWSRETTRVRVGVKYEVQTGYRFKYVYNDDGALHKRNGFIPMGTERGVFFSIGVAEALSQTAAPLNENFSELIIVYNDKFSAILGAIKAR